MSTRAGLALAAAAMFLAAPAQAQFIWSAGGGGNFSTNGNWLGGTAPPVGGGTDLTLSFPTGNYTATNDLTGAFSLNALNFNNNAGNLFTIAATGGSSLNFVNTAAAVGPTINIQGAGNTTISSPITLGNTLTVNGSGGGTGNLTISGAITGGANNLIDTAQGTLTLTGGGTMNQLSYRNGPGFISGGTYNLTAPTGGNLVAGLQIGAGTGQNPTVTVNNGSIVNITENLYLGDGVAGNFGSGILNVSGAGTLINIGTGAGAVSGRLAVGNFGNGALNISNGAVVNCLFLFNTRNAGSTGTLTVDGVGSQLNAVANNTVVNSGQFTIGNQGVGSITISNGGVARGRSVIAGNTGLVAGTSGQGDGTITVTGVGSLLEATGPAQGTVGTQMTIAGGTASSTGTTRGRIDVLAGAHVNLTPTTDGQNLGGNLFTAVQINTDAIINVDGSGSQFNVTTGQVSLSGGQSTTASGVTTMNITNGGLFSVGGPMFAAANGNTTINVTGAGSQLNPAGQFTMSGGGTLAGGALTMNVNTGGTVNVGGTAILGQSTAGGTANVTVGTGGTFNVTGQFQANNGTATFTVQGGGITTVTGIAFLATNPSSSATLAVTGAGSNFTTPGQITLSGGGGLGVAGGTAILNVSANATASAGLTILGQSDTSGSATMNVDTGGTYTANGQFQVAPTAGAAITAAVNVTGGGTVTINESAFFSISTASTSTLTVTGANSVFQTTGTGQIQFGGSGSTAGGTTTVNIGTGGTVRTSSDPAALVAVFSPATVNVNSGGTLQSPNVNVDGRLIANGAVNGAVTVNTGGFLGGTSGISGSIGTITGNVNVNSGATIRPGDGSSTGAGILTVAGAGSVVTVASGGTFSLNVNGPTPGNGANNHGQLLMTGGATINITGSTLQTTLGYAPNPGQVVTFITGGGVTGTFNGLPENQLFQVGTFNAVNYFANIHYTSNSVFFTVVPEPMHILGLGAMVCGGFTWWKKRRNTKATLAA